jgi:hypothetical protein
VQTYVSALSGRGGSGTAEPAVEAAGRNLLGIGRMSAWRDAQEEAGQLKRSRMWKAVRVLGLDGAYVLGWGEKRPVLVVVDLGAGRPVAIGYVEKTLPMQ